jgi:hypothetical protein
MLSYIISFFGHIIKAKMTKGRSMSAKIGLWIDHRTAVIVTLSDDGATTKTIKSNVEKHLRAAGDPSLKGPFKARLVPADDRHENEFNEHIKIYYNKIIETICNADAIYIFGPGEAKNEIKKQLEKNSLGRLVNDLETADKMTDKQILAKVCKHFNVNVPANINTVESPHQRMKTAAPSHPKQS